MAGRSCLIPQLSEQNIRAKKLERIGLTGCAFVLAALFLIGNFGIARAADGDLDAGFGTGGKVITDVNGSDKLRDIVLQPDGKIIALGYSGGRIELARYNGDGTLDAGFGNGGKVVTIALGSAGSVVLQPDGKILVCGSINSPSIYDTSFLLIRFNINGSFDTTFGNGGMVFTNFGEDVDSATALALQPDGKIVLVGDQSFDVPSDEERNSDIALARYNADGSLDPSFGSGGKTTSDFGPKAHYFADDALAVIIQPDGKIVLAGDSNGGGYYDFLVARYNSNGTLDTGFGSNGSTKTDLGNGYQDSAEDAVLQPDGKIILAGAALPSSYDYDFAIARYSANGTLDPTFGSGGKVVMGFGNQTFEEFTGVALQSDGKIVAFGDFSDYNQDGFLLVRFNANGAFDTTFGNAGVARTVFNSEATQSASVFIQPDGKIVAAGYTPLYQNSDFVLARYLSGSASARRTQFDFDGDGRADISVFRSGTWYLNRSSAGSFGTQFGLATDKVAPADFDGDGKADIAVYRDGTWYILQSANGQVRIRQFGIAEDLVVPGDFDGDSRADIAVWRAGEGTWYILRSSDGQTFVTRFGISEDKPVLGDFDGDGRTDIAVWRPSTGVWWILKSSGGYSSTRFGQNGDQPVAADYDGDNKTDLAVFRAGESNWYILQSSNGAARIFGWGTSNDIPAPADYDGDGKADPAIYRGGDWWIWQSGANNFSTYQYGISSDLPIISAYIR